MKPILRLLGFLTLFSLAQVASAQITFTFTATADSNATGQGYTSGQPYTFTFTLGNFTDLSDSFSRSSFTQYREEYTNSHQLWASVGGSGLGGSFVRPTGDSQDPYSLLQAIAPGNNNAIRLIASTEGYATKTVGLTALSGNSLSGISAYLEDAALPAWPMGQGEPTPTTPYDYFSVYAGNTYTGFTSGSEDKIWLVGAAPYFSISFTITSLTIGSAVPEPSTYAALFGVAALGVAVWRRRKRAA